MKKILISVVLIACIVLAYFVIQKNIKVADWNTKSIGDIKKTYKNLEDKIDTATELKNSKYPQNVEKIEKSTEKLKTAKEKYENKIKYISDDVELGVVQIKEYKIERLWITLQGYAKEENIKLKMDILDTSTKNAYDMEFTIVGEYVGITDFIYDIEKDDTLAFKILNFKLVPGADTAVSTEGDENNKASSSTDKLTATFKVENIGIEFD